MHAYKIIEVLFFTLYLSIRVGLINKKTNESFFFFKAGGGSNTGQKQHRGVGGSTTDWAGEKHTGEREQHEGGREAH